MAKSTFVQDFTAFAMRGNVLDMAVGVIIGGAFGKIVSSLVADIIMPLIGCVVGGVDFTKLSITLKEAVGDEPAVLFNYGTFLQNLFDSIFIFIRLISKFHRKQEEKPAEPAAPPAPSKEEQLLTEIRDLLKEKK